MPSYTYNNEKFRLYPVNLKSEYVSVPGDRYSDDSNYTREYYEVNKDKAYKSTNVTPTVKEYEIMFSKTRKRYL